jgi:prephenate dehydrogenase
MKAMQQFAPATVEILGLHPMFNDTAVLDMKSQMIVVCPQRKGPLASWMLNFFRKEGAILEETSPEEHDEMMSVIQGITHLSAIATGIALEKLRVTPAQSLKFSSPIYRLRLEMVGRVLHQSPTLYAEIALENPKTMEALCAYQEAINVLAEHTKKHNMKGFINAFSQASAHLGPFTKTAYQKTNKLLSTAKSLI